MTRFVPGKIYREITSNENRNIIFRSPRWSDLDKMLEYINALSKEDIFLPYCGEVITKQQEMDYLCSIFKDIENGNKVHLLAFEGEDLLGGADVRMDFSGFSRGNHVGIFGVALVKEARGVGIGYELSNTVIELAKKELSRLEIIILDVYSENENAIHLYQKLGFVEYGRLKEGIKYKGRKIDKIEMFLKV